MARVKRPVLLFPIGAKVYKSLGTECIGEMRKDVFKNEPLDIKQFTFYSNVVYMTVPEGFCIEDVTGVIRDPFTLKQVEVLDYEDSYTA